MLICKKRIKLQCTTDIIAQNYRSFKNIWHRGVCLSPNKSASFGVKKYRVRKSLGGMLDFDGANIVRTRTGICSARRGFRHGSGGAIVRTHSTKHAVRVRAAFGKRTEHRKRKGRTSVPPSFPRSHSGAKSNSYIVYLAIVINQAKSKLYIRESREKHS